MTPLARFGFHVAGLTQSHQVLTQVSFLSSQEFSERARVINGQAVPHIDTAVCTDPVLFSYDLKPYLRPATASICHWAADPERRIGASFVFAAVSVTAVPRAVESSELRTAYSVRFSFKTGTTTAADQRHRFGVLTVSRARQYRWCRIFPGGAADRIHNRCPVDARTSLRTEPASSSFRLTRESRYGRLASFTRRNHAFNRGSHQTILPLFGGTGTTALVAKALGRTGISIDLSQDYCRLAEWRCNDPRELAAALQIEKPEPVHPDQLDLFDEAT